MDMKHLNRFRTGGTNNHMELAVPLPKTPDGRTYRYSPNPDAHPRHFVLGKVIEYFVVTEAARARMKLEPRSKQTVCPYSGIVAADHEFTHPDDVKAAREVVEDATFRDVQDAMREIFSGFNNKFSGRKGLISIEAKVTPEAYRPKPRFVRRDLLRALVCDHCGRDYGVFAIGLFCPDCGAPNLRLHFAREVELVRQQVDLATAQSETAEELAYRLLGNSHEDVLTAFEATQKAVYRYGKVSSGTKTEDLKPVKNDFQNVEIAQRRFAELGIDPFTCLEPSALSDLRLNIQKRHVIGHNLGVMDEKFASHAEGVRVGETVRLVAGDVLAFAESCLRIVTVLDDWLAGSKEASMTINVGDATAKAEEVSGTKAPEQDLDLGLNIGPLAQNLGLWIAKQSEDGMSGFIYEDAIIKAFPNESTDALKEAIAELEVDDYVSCVHRGETLPIIKPTIELFATFDQKAIGSNPLTDAAQLAKKILEGDNQIDVAKLHAQTGWELRRFNPALSLVIGRIDSKRVSREMDSDYPTAFFFLLDTDRVSLKRFAQQAEA